LTHLEATQCEFAPLVVTLPYLLRRISPRLVQPLARSFERILLLRRPPQQATEHSLPSVGLL
jgi:hypothetical protein